jgi:hypothetical protein
MHESEQNHANNLHYTWFVIIMNGKAIFDIVVNVKVTFPVVVDSIDRRSSLPFQTGAAPAPSVPCRAFDAEETDSCRCRHIIVIFDIVVNTKAISCRCRQHWSSLIVAVP